MQKHWSPHLCGKHIFTSSCETAHCAHNFLLVAVRAEISFGSCLWDPGWWVGERTLPPCVCRNGRGFGPLRVGKKHAAGVKDLPGALSSTAWEVCGGRLHPFCGHRPTPSASPKRQCPPASADPMGQSHSQGHCRTSLLGLITTRP